MDLIAFLPLYVFTGTAAVVIAVLYLLHRSLVIAGWRHSERHRVLTTTALGLVGWLAAVVILAGSGAFHAEKNEVPTIQYAVLLPILAGAVLLWRSETVRRIVEAVPQRWLVGIQLYRALGLIFIVLYASGRLPGLFAWPAGLGDIAIGLSAPVVGHAYAGSPASAASLLRGWNLFGIADLIVAVGSGFATSPSLLVPGVADPNSAMMTVLPMVLIPAFLVPLSIVLHLASLEKLRREQDQGAAALAA